MEINKEEALKLYEYFCAHAICADDYDDTTGDIYLNISENVQLAVVDGPLLRIIFKNFVNYKTFVLTEQELNTCIGQYQEMHNKVMKLEKNEIIEIGEEELKEKLSCIPKLGVYTEFIEGKTLTFKVPKANS